MAVPGLKTLNLGMSIAVLPNLKHLSSLSSVNSGWAWTQTPDFEMTGQVLYHCATQLETLEQSLSHNPWQCLDSNPWAWHVKELFHHCTTKIKTLEQPLLSRQWLGLDSNPWPWHVKALFYRCFTQLETLEQPLFWWPWLGLDSNPWLCDDRKSVLPLCYPTWNIGTVSFPLSNAVPWLKTLNLGMLRNCYTAVLPNSNHLSSLSSVDSGWAWTRTLDLGMLRHCSTAVLPNPKHQSNPSIKSDFVGCLFVEII